MGKDLTLTGKQKHTRTTLDTMWIKMPGGGVAIVRTSSAVPRCRFCADRTRRTTHDGCLTEPAALLCDFEIGRTIGGAPITCDARVCVRCAHRVDGKDFCPKHPNPGGQHA